MNKYGELRARQQKEFDALPLGFAFGQKQFDEMMESWGLHPDNDINKIYCIGCGGYIQKKDAELLHQIREKHGTELAEAIAADKTGDGFIYDMFLCELNEHEYSYTRDAEDALEALAYTMEDLEADPRLLHGFEKAVMVIEGSVD